MLPTQPEPPVEADDPGAPAPSTPWSPLARRVAVAGLVVAAALGGLGVGVAWASGGDDGGDDPARPPQVPATDAGCEGGGAPDTSVL